MLKTILIFLIVLSALFLYSQDKINYNHKSIIREINKLNNVDNTIISEFEIPDSIKSSYRLQGKFFHTGFSNTESKVKYIYVGRVNTCRVGGCSSSLTQSSSIESEYFDYFILYSEKKKIISIKVFNYAATHGHEISARGWLKQYYGYDGNINLDVGKNIDAISGATISVSSINFDIQLKTDILLQVIN